MSTVSTLPTEIKNRLEYLSQLKDGWDNEFKSVKLSASVIQFCTDLLTQMSVELLEKIQIFPDPDGGIDLEWRLGTYDMVTCYIFNDETEDGSWVRIHNYNYNEFVSREFKFNQFSECVKTLIDFLRK